jgi:hypothetical protein
MQVSSQEEFQMECISERFCHSGIILNVLLEGGQISNRITKE